jgi:sulfite exporter TauE/SafE
MMAETALLMGLAGSLHCAGMCSPLAMAITGKKPWALNKVIYNTGRVVMYGLMGIVAASFGSMLNIGPYQSIVSMVVGAVFLFIGIGAISSVRIPYLTAWINRFSQWLKARFRFFLDKKSWLSVWMMGLLNGLMPCGLTYLALTYCFILPAGTDGFVFMIAFGMGTWPVMIGFTWLLNIGWGRLRVHYQKISTVIFLVVGIWLLLRVMVLPLHDPTHLTGKNSTEAIICP